MVATERDRASLASVRAAYPHVRFVETSRGRAHQMNTGARAAAGTWLMFLHADTHLPAQWRTAIAEAERAPDVSIGCFRFALDSRSFWARAIEAGVRLRVAVFDLPYGDQALFVRRAAFVDAGGYAEIPLMEDVDLVRRFRRLGRLYRSPHPAMTSARKWEREGWIRQSARNLWLIVRYFAGVPPASL